MKHIISVVLNSFLSILLLMGLSFQAHAVVDEDVIGDSFTQIAYYFPERHEHSHDNGEGAIVNDITFTYLRSDVEIPSEYVRIPEPVIGESFAFLALYSQTADNIYSEDYDGINIPEGYCPVQVVFSYSNPGPDPIVPDPVEVEEVEEVVEVVEVDEVVDPSDEVVNPPDEGAPPSNPDPTPSSKGGGGSSGGGGLAAIAVIGAVILIMNNRTEIKNSFFLDEEGMGFDLNKYGKLRMDSYLPNKHISVGILSWNIGLSKSIDFGLKSTFISTGQQRFNASLVYSF